MVQTKEKGKWEQWFDKIVDCIDNFKNNGAIDAVLHNTNKISFCDGNVVMPVMRGDYEANIYSFNVHHKIGNSK